MNHYRIRSLNIKKNGEIHATLAFSTLHPITYFRGKLSGNLEDLFRDLLSGCIKIDNGNRQKIHDAYLQARIYLQEKDIDTFDLYKKNYENDKDYDKAFQIFKQVLNDKKVNKKYYIKIQGDNLYSWLKHGYKSSYNVKKPLSYTDYLLAQYRYGVDEVSAKEVK